MALIELPNVSIEGIVLATDLTVASTVFTIPSYAVPWGKVVFRHIGSGGYWYGRFSGNIASTLVYDFKIGPGEPFPLDNPPIGAVSILASGAGIGSMSYSASWRK